MRNQTINDQDVRFLVDKNPPLNAAQLRELRTLNERVEAASETGDCDGLAEANERIGELLKMASSKLADAARDAGDYVGAGEFGAWAYGGVPEEVKGRVILEMVKS